MNTEKLISAAGAEQVIVKALVDCMIKHKGLYETSDAVLDALHSIPAVDAMPVVHAWWIWHEDEFSYECSACHCQFDYSCTFGMFDHGYEYASYCPNCNAKMDLEGEA